MKVGQVIGRVTLNVCDSSYRAGRFLLVLPLSRAQLAGAPQVPLAKGNSLVIYDNLGAGSGDLVAYSEGAEATAPFDQPTPVDAINCGMVDRIDYHPLHPAH